MALYVEFDEIDKYGGLFIHLEDDVNNGDKELRLLLVSEKMDQAAIPIPLNEATLYENLEHTSVMTQSNIDY